MAKIKFDKNQPREFITDLRQEVDQYFQENQLSKFGNYHMVIKSIIMLSMYLVPYTLILTGLITNSWVFWGLWIIMGVGMAGIGLSVMHDANHGAYSKNKTVNQLMGITLNFLGGSADNWKIQHNRLHHTYTNVPDMDPDISPPPILRFSPDAPLKKYHRFQFIYVWFLYGLSTFSWTTTKDFVRFKFFRDTDVIKDKEYKKLMMETFLWKIVYYFYICFIPLVVLNISFGFWLICYLSMHFTAGLILSSIFQTAHIMPDCEYPHANDEGVIENSWAIHQLQTTSNYAPNNRVLNWYAGGLNFQIEHHLFPTICHVHYVKIAKIVRQKAKEYKLPYYSQDTYFNAIWEHGRMLYRLGKAA